MNEKDPNILKVQTLNSRIAMGVEERYNKTMEYFRMTNRKLFDDFLNRERSNNRNQVFDVEKQK
jgi:hypothetical protein